MVIWIIIFLASVWGCSESRFDSIVVTEETPTVEEEPAIGEKVISDSKQYIQGETNSERPLDILLVIDVSRSMASVRNGLGTRLSALLKQIEQYDWRLAITTTNVEDCLTEGWILPKTPQGVFKRDKSKFKDIISNGEDSCGEICKVCPEDNTCDAWSAKWIWNSLRDHEYPIRMAINGLGGNLSNRLPDSTPDNDDDCQADKPCVYPEIPEKSKGKMLCSGRRSLKKLNNDWLRPESMIAVILVTDEDNSEMAKNVDGKEQQSIDLNTEELTKYLEKNLNRKKGLSYEIYGILNPNANESYKKIIPDTNNRQSVEDTDYEKVLGNISSGIMKVLNKTLDINDIASKANFSFKSITGKKEGIHYTRKGSIITFIDGQIPEKGDKITVNYSYKSTN